MSPSIRQTDSLLAVIVASTAILAGAAVNPAYAINWDDVDTMSTKVFHPGQASWEWALTPADHSARATQRFQQEGRNCQYCHGEEIDDLGASIASASGAAPESKPFDHRPGWIELDVQAAHDGDRMYWRFAWDAQSDGGKPMDPEHPARVTVLFATEQLREATRAGCWGACHDDLEGMESDSDDLDLSKYTMGSRSSITRSGGGENYRSDDELGDLLSGGQFFEYWQALIHQDGTATPIDGYVLEARHVHQKPAVSVEATKSGNRRIVTISRTMKAEDKTRKNLEPGKLYHGGFSVHEGSTEGRFHYVSLEYTFSIDSQDGDIAVMKQ